MIGKYIGVIYILIFIIFWWVWATQIYNFSYIPDTDSIQFNVQQWTNIYRVDVDWTNFYIVTGSDWIKYHCWEVKWTWVTEKIWLVYFGYTDNTGKYRRTYICNDWKRRWYAKIEAWWWIEFDNQWFTWAFLNEFKSIADPDYYYHSADWKWNWTGYAFTDWLWLWIWDTVKMDYNPRQEIIKYLNVTWIVIDKFRADFISWWNIKFKFIDNYNNPINWLNFYIYFTWYNNFFYHQWKTTIYFNSWNLYSGLDYIKVKNNLFDYPIVNAKCWYWNLSFIVWWGTGYKLFTTTWDFLCPFDIFYDVSDGDWDGYIYIWWDEKVSLSIRNFSSSISNFNFNWFKGTYSWKWLYNFISWWFFNGGVTNTGIKILPATEYVDDYIDVFYYISGSYDFSSWWINFSDIPFYNIKTDYKRFYADKNIDSVTTFSKCSWVKWDWREICKMVFRTLNNKNYSVPNLDILNVNISDWNYNEYLTNPQRTFDIDETDNNYTTWLFMESFSWYTDSRWLFDINIYSYKPVYSGKLNFEILFSWWYLYNISLTWVIFDKSMDIYFSGERITAWLLLDYNNQVDVIYEKLSNNIWYWDFYLSWSFSGCNDCEFLSGGIITWEIFQDQSSIVKSVSIIISGSQAPDKISYFDVYYSYYLSWNDWIKLVKLKPNVEINWRDLVIADQVYWFLQKGIAAWYNNWYLKTWNVIFVGNGKWVYDINNINYLVRKLKIDYKWTKFYDASLWNLDSINYLSNYDWFYKCNNNEVLQLWDWSNIIISWYNRIVLLNCDLIIKSNIIKNNINSTKDKLLIQLINYPFNFIDYYSTDWWRNTKNIYISSWIDTIMASLQTNWSLLFLTWNWIDINQIFVKNRWKNSYLKRQIYIKGSIRSLNTLGWWFVNSWYVMFPWGIKVLANSNRWYFWFSDIKADIVAQAYDINFFRANLVDIISNTYNTWNISKIILDKYSCNWDKNVDPPMCWMPVVVEYERY